ncbi:MAG: hypothetical protein WA973_06560 [Mesorhizobium sp.]
MAVQKADYIWRDFETDGISASGFHKPINREIRERGTWVENAINAGLSNGGLIYDTKASMDADLAHDANASAWVMTGADAGIYRKSGASGSGAWTKIASLPYSYIKASNVGAGTANALQATTDIPVPAADGAALVALPIFADNTASPVTVAINGGTVLTIKTASGNDVAPGGLKAGMIVSGYVSGSTFRMLSDQASAAIQAAAEAAQLASESARDASASSADRAESYAAMLSADKIKFPTVPAMLADTAMSYSAGENLIVVGAGDVIEAGEFRYEVVGQAAPDNHLATAAGVKLDIIADSDDTIPLAAFGVSDTASLASAISKADAAEKWLDWGAVAIAIDSQVFVTLANPLRWKSSGAKVTYVGISDILNPFQINLPAEVKHQLLGGGWNFDGNGKVHIGPRFTQPLSSTGTKFLGERMVARNVECQEGAGVGSSGIQIRGGFGLVELIEPGAENISIRPGAGVLGAIGVVGIQVVNNPANDDAYPLATRIIRPKIRRVYSQDAAYAHDMDGIGVFAHPDTCNAHGMSRLKVIDADIIGCWGRDIKTQVGYTSITDPTGVVNEGPTGGKQYPFYGIQAGLGEVIGGEQIVDGHVCNTAASIIMSNLSNAASKGIFKWEKGSVRVVNGGKLDTCVHHYPSIPTSKVAWIVDGTQILEGSVREIVDLGTNGADKDTLIVRNTVSAELTGSLARVTAAIGGAAPYRAFVDATNNIQLGTPVPTLITNVPGLGATAIFSDRPGIGFTQSSTTNGNAANQSGITILDRRGPMPVPTSSGSFLGASERYFSVTLANDETFDFPAHGYGSYEAHIRTSKNSRQGFARISYDTGGIVEIAVGTDFKVGTTADPGTGSFRLWRESGALRLKNSDGSLRTFTILLRG